MNGYDRIGLLVARVLRAIGTLSRVPEATRLDLEEVDGSVLEDARPVFVLSTGRCGTKWLSELLRRDRRIRVNHSDYPELLRESRMAFEEYAAEPRLFQEILRAARDGYLLDATLRGATYVETNHRITFFAHAINVVYPGARFVHLHRHPGEFVRSGIRRRWYGGSYLDICRPRLAESAAWQAMNAVQKLAWLWNTTNRYCEEFLAALEDPRQCLQVRASEMYGDAAVAAAVCEFVGANVSAAEISGLIGRKINQQLTGRMPSYEDWTEEDKAALRRLTPLAARYGYEL